MPPALASSVAASVAAPVASFTTAGGAKQTAAAAGGAADAPQREAAAVGLVQVKGLFLAVCLVVALATCNEALNRSSNYFPMLKLRILNLCLSYSSILVEEQ